MISLNVLVFRDLYVKNDMIELKISSTNETDLKEKYLRWRKNILKDIKSVVKSEGKNVMKIDLLFLFCYGYYYENWLSSLSTIFSFSSSLSLIVLFTS